MVKEKIKTIQANKTINQLNSLFKDNIKKQTVTTIIYTQFIARY